jgi:hypothetical protein
MQNRRNRPPAPSEASPRPLIVERLLLILVVMVVAALFNSEAAAQVMLAVTGLLGTAVGYYLGCSQWNRGAPA